MHVIAVICSPEASCRQNDSECPGGPEVEHGRCCGGIWRCPKEGPRALEGSEMYLGGAPLTAELRHLRLKSGVT